MRGRGTTETAADVAVALETHFGIVAAHEVRVIVVVWLVTTDTVGGHVRLVAGDGSEGFVVNFVAILTEFRGVVAEDTGVEPFVRCMALEAVFGCGMNGFG